MVRPYTIQDKPSMVPYTCIRCGVGQGRREWFVDLGWAIDHYFDTGNQAIYLCNECFGDMTVTVGRLVQTFRKDHEKWNSEQEPTYEWAGVHDVRESESGESDSGVAGNQLVASTTGSSSDRDDQDSEPDNSESEQPDSGDANATDDGSSDGTGPLKISFGTGELP